MLDTYDRLTHRNAELESTERAASTAASASAIARLRRNDERRILERRLGEERARLASLRRQAQLRRLRRLRDRLSVSVMVNDYEN